MKSITKIGKIIFVLLFVSMFLIECGRDYAQSNYARDRYLMFALLESQTGVDQTAAQTACLQAIYKLNECVSSAYGYNPQDSCGTGFITGTETEYTDLLTCASTQILATSCNLDQNKYQYASEATSGAFEDCITITRTDGTEITLAQ